jgi:hypothetical protein
MGFEYVFQGMNSKYYLRSRNEFNKITNDETDLFDVSVG